MSEMTLGELRRELAEALGYTIICGEDGIWTVTAPTGQTKRFELHDDPLSAIPDWPRDTDAALALCRQLAIANDYELLLSWSGAYTFVSFSPLSMAGIRWSHEARSTDASTTPDGHDAEALARLAWEYYRGVGK